MPFGGTRWESGSTPTDFQFTGQRKEAGFGLYDYHARYYDPTLGRFVSADSVVPGAGNPQALNRYGYVFNNPLKYVDPTGHCPWCIFSAAAGAVVGLGIYATSAGQNASWQGALASAGVGAAAGFLIGTGVGAAAGIVTLSSVGSISGAALGSTAVTVGTAMASTQIGYTMVARDQFDTYDMVANTAIAGTTALATRSLPPVGQATATQNIMKVGASVLATEAQYLATSDHPTAQGVIVEGGVGLIAGTTGLLGEAYQLVRFNNTAEINVIPNLIRSTGVEIYNRHVENNICSATQTCIDP
jgi:RHS repeat-associated protein